jgi:hypothetical protein
MSYYLKDPDSRVDYAIDWLAFLGGQTVAASEWEVVPLEEGGLVVDEERAEPARTAACLSGGVVGHVYTVSNLVTLSDGCVDERSICLRVEQR